MTKIETLVLFAFSIIIMYGVFWMKTMYFDAPAVAQEDDN